MYLCVSVLCLKNHWRPPLCEPEAEPAVLAFFCKDYVGFLKP